ncbi:HAD family hydrolase [Legionella sp. PC1000]|uniref:HAD family hydrolase n=1 Tax=Legionella sp. PC1000 TaxID=2746060 RepID=UPI0015FCA244|nr:HAD family hydrolase [Legionella sp. PC1000]QLZ69942.1 HAD family hydrolase [Legionella sp. PC1000]
MPKENGFHQRQQILFAKLNDIEAEIPIIVAATSEELSQPENHFNMTEEEKQYSRLQLFIKKGKMFGYNGKQPTTKITGLASNSITLFGKPRQISPVSIMQNEALFSLLKVHTNAYLEKVLKAPTKENKENTYLEIMVNRLYQIIKKACPSQDEVIHLATMERDLSEPESGKNRLTAEFSTLLLTELRKKIAQNNDPWKVELDRVLALKQRTSRAESYGIHRIAQQALTLYQSRNIAEKIIPNEKVIMIDDHIQAGSAISCAADEIRDNNANLLSIVCITAHKNNKFFNIQPDVKEFIISLLPNTSKDLPRLNEILRLVGLSMETLTNIEGMILISILCDSNNPEHKSDFQTLLKKYDASDDMNHSLFEHQKDSLMEEFEKPKVEFAHFERELLAAIKKGRYTVSYEKQIVLSDEEGQNIRKEIDKRAGLPWLLFDFDDTLHNLNNSTFIIFQDIIKIYSGIEIPIETIRETRQTLKDRGQYQYQQMLLDFIRQHNPSVQVSFEEITKAYQEHKNAEPFAPKMSKEDFLTLRNKYRIGIITDGSAFASKVPKIREFYGVDIDGYINSDNNLPKKPNPAMFHEFRKVYNVKDKPIAYVGDRDDLDGVMARNVNLDFISIDPMQSTIDMEKFTRELNTIEERRKAAIKKWKELMKYAFLTNATEKSSRENLPLSQNGEVLSDLPKTYGLD